MEAAVGDEGREELVRDGEEAAVGGFGEGREGGDGA